MTPLNTIILADDANEPVRQRVEAEGVAVDEVANETTRCDRVRVMLERFKRESMRRPAHEDRYLLMLTPRHVSG